MRGDEIRLVRDGDALDVDDENSVRKAVNGLLGLSVDPSSMTLNWFGGSPFLGAVTPPIFATFWTTSTIGSAAVTGTLVSNAVRTQGSGTARPCIKDSSNRDIPDTNASDVTIYNDVVIPSSGTIPSGRFVDCIWLKGRWVVVLVQSCS